jgi:NADPH:quinone reductase
MTVIAKRPTTMRAVRIKHFGGTEGLTVETLSVPTRWPGELLIRAAAAGLNRGDISQRQGRYPSPTGTSDTMGL